MTLVKIVIMAAMLSSSVAMASKTCTFRGPDGVKITGVGEDIKAAKRDARVQCGMKAIDDNFNAKGDMSEDTFALNTDSCVNKECE